MNIIPSQQPKISALKEQIADENFISEEMLISNWKSVHADIDNSVMKHNDQKINPAPAVNLIAVSKTKPLQMIVTLAEQGQEHFGENYLQDALTKIQDSKDFMTKTGCRITWHYIGRIQRNKTRDIAQNFQWVHTLDRIIIAQRLNEQRPANMAKLNVLLQVNIDDEYSKAGCTSEELPMLVDTVSKLENLQLRGLMVIPAQGNSDSLARTKELFEQIKMNNPELTAWDTLSMGMSADLDEAIAQGSTMVRIGTAIFGSRS